MDADFADQRGEEPIEHMNQMKQSVGATILFKHLYPRLSASIRVQNDCFGTRQGK
jgi:hypothetical protein